MSQSTQLSTFNFEQSSIRVIAVNNEPWFVAKDVCDTLGIKNPTQALENLDEDERAMFNIGLEQRVNFDNRVSEINIVSESGMYTLILRCRDAVKKGSVPHRFRKWVTAEVLPQIRKTGKYAQQYHLQPIDPMRELMTKEMPIEHWLHLASMWYSLYNCVELLDRLKMPLEKLGSVYSPQVFGHATEYQITLGVLKRILTPILEDIDVPKENLHYNIVLEKLRNYKPKGLGAIAKI